jgi:hypothetical protein
LLRRGNSGKKIWGPVERATSFEHQKTEQQFQGPRTAIPKKRTKNSIESENSKKQEMENSGTIYHDRSRHHLNQEFQSIEALITISPTASYNTTPYTSETQYMGFRSSQTREVFRRYLMRRCGKNANAGERFSGEISGAVLGDLMNLLGGGESSPNTHSWL